MSDEPLEPPAAPISLSFYFLWKDGENASTLYEDITSSSRDGNLMTLGKGSHTYVINLDCVRLMEITP